MIADFALGLTNERSFHSLPKSMHQIARNSPWIFDRDRGPVRSSVPLGHKLMAVVVAVAACGSYTFRHYREAQQVSAASLSFDFAQVQQQDSGVTDAPHPTVILAQSILSDSVVAKIIPPADLAASSVGLAIGEFRTRLELSQTTSGILRIHYRDPDPVEAAATANAIARALAAWAPSTTSTLPPAATAPPAPASDAATQHASVAVQPALAPAAAAQHASDAGPSLAAALGELHA
jgi:hypothetical protein